MSKRPPFVKVATVADVPFGAIRHVVVHDKPMALCNVDGQFYAVNAVCPHMGGPLASGHLARFIHERAAKYALEALGAA